MSIVTPLKQPSCDGCRGLRGAGRTVIIAIRTGMSSARVASQNDISPTPTHIPMYHPQPMIWLLFYIIAVSLYDLRTRRIPNWCTLPLVIAGIIVHFPGHMDLWLACFLLLSAWSGGWMGAGDVKLWMAVLLALPDSNIPSLILLVFLSFLITGMVQMLWRLIRKRPASRIQTPAAWRTIPFLLMVWYVH